MSKDIEREKMHQTSRKYLLICLFFVTIISCCCSSRPSFSSSDRTHPLKVLKRRKILHHNSTTAINHGKSPRNGRFLSLFTVVSFQNEPCLISSGQAEGTCYSQSDCSTKGGMPDGICAKGFGVCCKFSYQCGGQTSANNTVFTNPTSPRRICSLTLEHQNICQIRLEFNQFSIVGPNSVGECNSDYFTVFGAGNPIPVLCGENSQSHIIYDVISNGGSTKVSIISDLENISFQRRWNIRLYLYDCQSPNLAPSGCLQYFTGPIGSIKSFNFKTEVTGDNSNHLSNLNYGICIRNENGFCGIRYSQAPDDPYSFTLSLDSTLTAQGTLPLQDALVKLGSECTTDFIMIPSGGLEDIDLPGFLTKDRFCGGALGRCADNGQATGCLMEEIGPVTSYALPFVINVVTDVDESQGAQLEKANRGFNLNYVQVPCSTSFLGRK